MMSIDWISGQAIEMTISNELINNTIDLLCPFLNDLINFHNFPYHALVKHSVFNKPFERSKFIGFCNRFLL